MPDIVIQSPAVDAIEAQNSTLIAGAHAVVVTTQEEHGDALVILQRLTAAERGIGELFAEPKKRAHAAHRSICDAEARLLRPIADAKGIVNRKVVDYEAAAKRKAEEEQRRLEAEARKREEERQLAEAIRAEEAGDVQLAETIISEPVTPPAVMVMPAVAKVEGVSSRETWHAELTDKMALVRFVAAHPEWERLLDANMPALNALARSARKGMNIPGVRAVAEASKAFRVAR